MWEPCRVSGMCGLSADRADRGRIMRISGFVRCQHFPCTDVEKGSYAVPHAEVVSGKIRIAMISEVPPADPRDYLYTKGNPLQAETTLTAFRDAGVDLPSMQDLLALGVYVTTALKCGKTGYGVSAKSIQNCSLLLEEELGLFPNLKVLLLMGDVAIKALDYIARRQTGKRVIPAGSTYKIRKHAYFFHGKRVFPSYLQAGPAFFIEKSKRRMIAEDIRNALHSIGMT
jgi:uracil-DNA glycosylase